MNNADLLAAGTPLACIMGRIVAIDFGKKRTGLAVTDPLGSLQQPWSTVPFARRDSVSEKILSESRRRIRGGMPKTLMNQIRKSPPSSEILKLLNTFPKALSPCRRKITSHIARRAMLDVE